MVLLRACTMVLRWYAAPLHGGRALCSDEQATSAHGIAGWHGHPSQWQHAARHNGPAGQLAHGWAPPQWGAQLLHWHLRLRKWSETRGASTVAGTTGAGERTEQASEAATTAAAVALAAAASAQPNLHAQATSVVAIVPVVDQLAAAYRRLVHTQSKGRAEVEHGGGGHAVCALGIGGGSDQAQRQTHELRPAIRAASTGGHTCCSSPRGMLFASHAWARWRPRGATRGPRNVPALGNQAGGNCAPYGCGRGVRWHRIARRATRQHTLGADPPTKSLCGWLKGHRMSRRARGAWHGESRGRDGRQLCSTRCMYGAQLYRQAVAGPTDADAMRATFQDEWTRHTEAGEVAVSVGRAHLRCRRRRCQHRGTARPHSQKRFRSLEVARALRGLQAFIQAAISAGDIEPGARPSIYAQKQQTARGVGQHQLRLQLIPRLRRLLCKGPGGAGSNGGTGSMVAQAPTGFTGTGFHSSAYAWATGGSGRQSCPMSSGSWPVTC